MKIAWFLSHLPVWLVLSKTGSWSSPVMLLSALSQSCWDLGRGRCSALSAAHAFPSRATGPSPLPSTSLFPPSSFPPLASPAQHPRSSPSPPSTCQTHEPGWHWGVLERMRVWLQSHGRELPELVPGASFAIIIGTLGPTSSRSTWHLDHSRSSYGGTWWDGLHKGLVLRNTLYVMKLFSRTRKNRSTYYV